MLIFLDFMFFFVLSKRQMDKQKRRKIYKNFLFAIWHMNPKHVEVTFPTHYWYVANVLTQVTRYLLVPT